MVGYLPISQILEAFGLQAKSFEVVQLACYVILAVSVALSSIFVEISNCIERQRELFSGEGQRVKRDSGALAQRRKRTDRSISQFPDIASFPLGIFYFVKKASRRKQHQADTRHEPDRCEVK